MTFEFIWDDMISIRQKLGEYVPEPFEIGIILFKHGAEPDIKTEANYLRLDEEALIGIEYEILETLVGSHVELDESDYGLSYVYAYKTDKDKPITGIELFYNDCIIIDYLHVIDLTKGFVVA